MSATDFTTHASWSPLLWTGSASIRLHLCCRKISTSSRCLVMLTKERLLTLCRTRALSCQPCVTNITPSSSHARFAPSSVRRGRRSMYLQLEIGRLTRKWCWNCCSFQCCVSSSPASCAAVSAPSWDASAAGTTLDVAISGVNLGFTALPAGFASQQVSQLFTLRIYVLVVSLTSHP